MTVLAQSLDENKKASKIITEVQKITEVGTCFMVEQFDGTTHFLSGEYYILTANF